ncbi:MAG: hypothetical protein AB8C13_00400 [Phycisphaerales bacterium]
MICILQLPFHITPLSNQNWIYILDTEQGVIVLTTDDYLIALGNGQGSKLAFAQAVYEPVIHNGPVKGLIEWSVQESIFSTADNIYPRQQLLTDEETDRAHQALIQYANADPNMIPFRPGEPPQTRFSWRLLGYTILRLAAISIFSTLVVLFIKFVFEMDRSIRHARKRNRGLCIHCGYLCANLESLRCPECGNFHTVPFESASETKDQSHA